MSVLIVDWLGRGGIAQCTWALAESLRQARRHVTIVTRPNRELRAAAGIDVVSAGTASMPILAHLQVVNAARNAIRELRPETVVIQNFVLAPVEGAVADVARRTGSKVVHVLHEHRLHTRSSGTNLGLRRTLQRADAVVTHTAFVAERVANFARLREIRVVPLPMQVGMFDLEEVVDDPTGPPWCALHFGVLHRSYKGTSTFNQVAASAPSDWRFRAIGLGAVAARNVEAVDGFVDDRSLVKEVDRASATLLPYRLASQSGAVVLSHARRTVPIAAAVGGIPEQIEDEVDGLLLAADAPIGAWRSALERLSVHDEWQRMADAGRERVRREHDSFVRSVEQLT